MYEQLLVQSIARRTYGSMRVKRELWAAEITKGVAFLDFDFLVFLTFFRSSHLLFMAFFSVFPIFQSNSWSGKGT